MFRSSFAAKGLFAVLALAAAAACGGDAPKPPETPSTPTVDAGETPAPATDTADAGATSAAEKPAEPAPPPAPAKLDLPTATAKLKFKEKKQYDLEVKSDGTVNNAGKAAAKITGMELQDPGGKTQLKVDADGTITTGEGAAYAKFEGDELATLTSVKYAIADDGKITSTDDKGKKADLGKAEGVEKAKRASLLAVAFAMWNTKAPAPKKAAEKPAAKK